MSKPKSTTAHLCTLFRTLLTEQRCGKRGLSQAVPKRSVRPTVVRSLRGLVALHLPSQTLTTPPCFLDGAITGSSSHATDQVGFWNWKRLRFFQSTGMAIVVSPMESRIRILHLENARNSLANWKYASLNLPQCGAVTSPKFVPDPS